MRIALAQLNPIVGDIPGNTALVLDAIERARTDTADLVVCPELVLVGYPPRDVLFRDEVIDACEQAVQVVAGAARDITVAVGYPRRDPRGVRPIRNSVAICRDGEVVAIYDKRLLPGYDVFDEDRYFEPGHEPLVVEVAGQRVGVLVCEDLWQAGDVDADRHYQTRPIQDLARLECDVFITLNASPFVAGKWKRHLDMVIERARAIGVPIVSVNEVGGNDDVVFDGRSIVVASDGALVAALPGWEPAVVTVDLSDSRTAIDPPQVDVDPMDELFGALVLGVSDYCRKTGQDGVLLGLSGGIDSSLVATIAAAALGPAQVMGVMMPSQYSSAASREDAAALAHNLGMADPSEISIEALHETAKAALATDLGDQAGGLTDENIQARMRGLLLMAIANATGRLLLATGNKSELAVGYCTLYGDMNGALLVIGDVLKTTVYELASWINANYESCGFRMPPIPGRCLRKAPSAELRDDQTDQDTLPPYEVLDEIVRRYVEAEESAECIVAATGLDAELVGETVGMIDRSEYKRYQSAVVLKTSARAFGPGRPMPLALKMSTDLSRLMATAARKAALLEEPDERPCRRS